MDKGAAKVTIKKYATRRLYDTESSSYITLDRLAAMIREGRDFEVVDAKTGEDITHNAFACSFLEAFVPGVDVPAPGPDAPQLRVPASGPSPDCARTAPIAVERWLADRTSKARAIVPLDAALAAEYAGKYQFPGRVVTIENDGGRLFVDFPAGVRSELFATSPDDLFVKVRPWTMTAVRDGGKVVRFDIDEAGSVYEATRVE